MQADLLVGFLGAGKMATAMAQGLVKAGLVKAGNIMAADVAEGARSSFTRAVPGARVFTSNVEVVREARVVVLAVKPGQAPEVLREVQPFFTPEHLLVSIAAGVTLNRLQSLLGSAARVVRVMPNTPALVGAAACGFAMGERVLPSDAGLVERMLSAIGCAFEVKESLLDAVTGLSGSGPAYAFLIIEALSDGGVAAGLPREIATRLAAQTLLGSARMVLETGLHPGALKDMVTSPGGTTIEGLQALEQAGVRSALIQAVRAAAEKSARLGQA